MARERKAWAIPKGREGRAQDEDESDFFRHLQDAQRSLDDAIHACREFGAKHRHTIRGRRASTAQRQVRRAHGLLSNMGWLTPVFDLDDPDLTPTPTKPKVEKRAQPEPPKTARTKGQRRRARKEKALRESKMRRGPRARSGVNRASA